MPNFDGKGPGNTNVQGRKMGKCGKSRGLGCTQVQLEERIEELEEKLKQVENSNKNQ